MQSVADIWTMILTRLREDLSETTIKTWFDETSVVSLEGNTLVLHCPNDFKRNNIQDRFLPSIEASLKDIFSSDMTVRLLDDEGLRLYRHPEEKKTVSLMESGEFTFDTFVVGPSNTMAHAAAQAVADAPGQHYNPLLIYGDSGLGKTHLLYAIAHVIRSRDRSARLVYIKGDDFINEFIELIRAGRGSEFRTKYREADLLLVDDVQFLAGKDQVQNEFFHTFNTLFEAKKQIVLTSDRPPHEMTLLDDRLRTRFEWGLLTDVKPPDLETRIAILKNKAVQLGFILDEETANPTATKITANVRQLEGTIKKIKAFKELHGMPVNRETADRAIQDMSQSNEFRITPENIIKEVCRYYHIEEDQLRGPSRSRDCLNARQVAMYLIRRLTSLSQDDTGKLFGGRDHATVYNALKKVEKQMKSSPAFAETVKAITTNINSTK